MILVVKFGDHLPLNRQRDAFAREGIELDVSTLADWVGACAAALDPILSEIRRHVLAAERLHMDDTTVPALAKIKARTGRLWTYLWTVPAMQGLLRQVGKCSVAAIYSVFGATSLLTLMRYADWRPITLAGFLSPIDPAG